MRRRRWVSRINYLAGAPRSEPNSDAESPWRSCESVTSFSRGFHFLRELEGVSFPQVGERNWAVSHGIGRRVHGGRLGELGTDIFNQLADRIFS